MARTASVRQPTEAAGVIDWHDLASHGFCVFPLKPREKRPLGSWERFQTGHPTADELAKWSADSKLNAAIATGKVSGIIVLDTDNDTADAEVRRRGIPQTPVVRTAKGRHYYFRRPDGEVRNFTGKIPGVDLRGDGGYVVAAGSTHPSGHVYVWEVSPTDTAIADAPAWLLDLIKAKDAPAKSVAQANGLSNRNAYAEAALDSERAMLRRATKGTRNDTLNRAAFNLGTLAGAGALSQSYIGDLLLAEAVNLGLDEREARATIASGLKAGMAEPRQIPERPQRPAPSSRADAGDDDQEADDGIEVEHEVGRPSQADILVDLAKTAELFHDKDRTGFADVIVNGHRETWPLRSQGFRRWLMRRLWDAAHKAARGEAISTALGMLEANAQYDGQRREVFVRVGHHHGRDYIDLCDESWRAVEIDCEGWRIVDRPPVRFRRSKGMLALPVPVSGGSVSALRKYLNVANEHDFVLTVAWLVAALHARGPYPVLSLNGEQGSAKSTSASLLRSLLDPNSAPLRSLPREERDLFVAANNSHVIAFDNVSGLPSWISDALCKLATGGGFSARQLYTDAEELLIDVKRPAILNGIEDMISRPDLADRAIPITLEAIPEAKRRTEAEIWRAFEADRPAILGALLSALSCGLRNIDSVKLDRLPRMADFAKLIVAAEPAIWPTGTFMTAYDNNRATAVDVVIEADPVAAAIRRLAAAQADWSGTASELLAALVPLSEPTIIQSKGWPKASNVMSGRLRRAATFLRQVGIQIAFGNSGRAKTRIIRITQAIDAGETPPASSASSANIGNPTNHADDLGRSADDHSAFADDHSPGPFAEKRQKPINKDDGDGADDLLPRSVAYDEVML